MSLVISQWELKFGSIWIPWLSSHANIQRTILLYLHINSTLKFGDLEIFKAINYDLSDIYPMMQEENDRNYNWMLKIHDLKKVKVNT